METVEQKFIHTRLFKIIVLAVYVYSFIQLEADESPIQFDLVQLDDPFMMKKIQLEVTAPMKILVRIMGKHKSDKPGKVETNQLTNN